MNGRGQGRKKEREKREEGRRESGKPFWTKLRTPDRDSTFDLSVIGNLVQQDSDTSEHMVAGADLETDDEDSCPPTRCLPDRLETISQATKFTKDEIRYVYRAFKTECPSGIISEATFKSIYAKFFPLGDSSQYAHYVFTNLDKGHTGIITFRDFMFGMSVVMKGSLQERLRWAFSLYDINHDGFITRQELLDVISAIYSLLGDSRDRPKKSTLVHKLDLNNDGVVTIDEFIHYCSRLANALVVLSPTAEDGEIEVRISVG
uniref:EF-hand domain-containing protein n=1 Tax=Timema shepardi TaxID=629360 RepID=A0A7R9ARZ7_TIMSH|nr:unnamed protein product [Timema shepardi]